MGLLLQHRIVHEEAKNEIGEVLASTLLQGDPQNPLLARRAVGEARRAAIARGFVNDNLLIAEVLEEAGINHIPLNATNPYGPDFLNHTSYPGLFDAADHLEFGDKGEFIRGVGGVVDTYTPDANYAERGVILHGFVGSVLKNSIIQFEPAQNALIVDGQTYSDVLIPFNPELEPKGWTVSPYARTLAPFIIEQAS